MGKLIDTIKKECKIVDPSLDWFEVYYEAYNDPDLSEKDILKNVKELLNEIRKRVHIRESRQNTI